MVMGKKGKREHLSATPRGRYKKATKAAKKAILDEFCRACDIHLPLDSCVIMLCL